MTVAVSKTTHPCPARSSGLVGETTIKSETLSQALLQKGIKVALNTSWLFIPPRSHYQDPIPTKSGHIPSSVSVAFATNSNLSLLMHDTGRSM